MRVAVRHTDENHPNHGWFAFEQSRILGHTDPMTGVSHSVEEVAEALLNRAKERFPALEGYEHRLETLHTTGIDAQGNEVGEWREVGTSDLPQTEAGEVVASHDMSADQAQEGDTQ